MIADQMRMKVSLRSVIVAAMPSILVIALFYSFALHMHHALGG